MAISFVQQTFVDNSSTVPISAANLNALEGAVKTLSDWYDTSTTVYHKVLTGTTPSTQGDVVYITHGITISKIVALDGIVEISTGVWIRVGHELVSPYNTDNYRVGLFTGSTQIGVGLHSTASGSVLSKPIKILITYTP